MIEPSLATVVGGLTASSLVGVLLWLVVRHLLDRNKVMMDAIIQVVATNTAALVQITDSVNAMTTWMEKVDHRLEEIEERLRAKPNSKPRS